MKLSDLITQLSGIYASAGDLHVVAFSDAEGNDINQVDGAFSGWFCLDCGSVSDEDSHEGCGDVHDVVALDVY